MSPKLVRARASPRVGLRFRGVGVRLTQRLLGGFPPRQRHHCTLEGVRTDPAQRAIGETGRRLPLNRPGQGILRSSSTGTSLDLGRDKLPTLVDIAWQVRKLFVNCRYLEPSWSLERCSGWHASVGRRTAKTQVATMAVALTQIMRSPSLHLPAPIQNMGDAQIAAWFSHHSQYSSRLKALTEECERSCTECGDWTCPLP
jgi:hypothetical protein